jgi:DNA-binding sugar fermentation-stimulating protein
MTKTDGSYPLTIVIVTPTRLPEFAIPETLVLVDFEAKSLKQLNHSVYIFYGNDDIVTVDTHLPNHLMNETAGEGFTSLVSNRGEDNGCENHCFDGKAESRAHRRELDQGYDPMARHIGL